MGNRCVITTENDFKANGLGVYLHWNGGRDSVEAFLKYCEMKGYGSPERDCYGWARLCQVIGNFFGGTSSVGIDTVGRLDCNNGDNGVYIIKNWKITGREFFEGNEQDSHNLKEMLLAIDEAQPKTEQIKELILSEKINRDEVKIGDKIVELDWRGSLSVNTCIGFGKDRVLNGHDVKGIPFTDEYGENNINSYLLNDTVYILKEVQEEGE